ncbi:TPA: hypothetical protein ACKLN5_002214, partial [Neisseria gonorrhoeae]
VFVHPPYCVETPPGTRYNPPFNISENLFFNRSNRYKEPKMNPARKKPSLLFSSLLFSSLLFSSLLFSSLLFSSLPQRRRQVKTAAAARMCRRI